MSGNGVVGVPGVIAEFYPQALAASDLMSLHPPQQLSRLTREHRPDNQLNAALEFR